MNEPLVPVVPNVSHPAQPLAGSSLAAGQVQVDLSRAKVGYANFARVTGTPEELILDFGLSMQPFSPTPPPIKSEQQVVLGFLTAKRLLAALQMAVSRHEQAFGRLELDVQARVGGAKRNIQ